MAGSGALIGLLLRLSDYQSIPYRAPNPDEWNWEWSGLSQLLGMPATAWTLFWKAYPQSVWQAPPPPFTEPLVHPWVDAPPLFSWIIGFWSWLGGDRTLLDTINDPRPRLFGIALSITAMLLAYLLGRMVIGVWPSLVGLWLVATAPIPVVLGRLIAAEQLIAVLLLAALLAVLHLRRDPLNRRWQAVLFACVAVGPAVKAPGLVIGISAALALLASRHLRLAAIAAGVMVAAQLVVIGYEAAVNWQSYIAEVGIRGSQLSGLTAMRFITNTTGFDGQQAFDGWWLLGWLALAELIGRRRGDFDLLVVPCLVYLLLMLGTAAHYSSGYGWYRLAIMPLVYSMAGRFLWLAVSELSWARLGLAAALGIATAANFGAPLHVTFTANLMGFVVVIAMLPALLALAFKEVRPWARSAAMVLLLLVMPVGVLEVANLGYIYGQH